MDRRVVVGLVALQLVVAATHGLAHGELGVTLPALLTWLVALTTFLGPVAGAVLTWRRHPAGPPVVAGSLLGAAGLGVALHFAVASADNVAAVGTGIWPAGFRWTAVALALVQGGGVIAALVLWRRRGVEASDQGRDPSPGNP